ncbi:hypothetical protein QBE54_00870 [Thermatribacter velox]|uniref:Uncharacterized protein n=1 Tax=Thermatribacter velox TaxID=3039681 RepID=A0ABZ2YDG0_9BACT
MLIYQQEGGSRSIGASAASGSGFRINVVTNLENSEVWGIEFLVLTNLSTYQIMVQPFKVMPLLVFLHPDAIQDLLNQADVLAQQGIVVRGGAVSENSIWVGIEEDVSSTDIWMSTEGLVQRFQYLTRQHEGSGVVYSQYLKHLYIDWPRVNEFPLVAQESHTYDIYITSYGVTSPAGSGSYELSSVQGEIARYRVVQFYSGMSLPSEEVMGVPSFGPFYVHPELLKKRCNSGDSRNRFGLAERTE